VRSPAHLPFFDVGEAAVVLADPTAPEWRAFWITEEARYLRLGAPAGMGAHLAASFTRLGFCVIAPGLDGEAAKLFVGARTAAAVKVLHRAFIGVWKTPEAIEEGVGAFLNAHVSPEGPFLEARIVLDREREEPGYHRFELTLRPNRDAGLPVTIRIGGKLDKE
jgi:predicted component of type VI protein secretion system